MTRPSTWEGPRTIVDEVCDGCIQVLTFLGEQGAKAKGNMGALWNAGTVGRIEDAHTWIFEFIKDGITQDAIDACMADPDGFRAQHRETTARYLQRMGVMDL